MVLLCNKMQKKSLGSFNDSDLCVFVNEIQLSDLLEGTCFIEIMLFLLFGIGLRSECDGVKVDRTLAQLKRSTLLLFHQLLVFLFKCLEAGLFSIFG